MTWLDDKIKRGGGSKDTVKSWFWNPGASVLLSVEIEEQERSLVIKERGRVGTKNDSFS